MNASRIGPCETAFALSTGMKRPRVEAADHLAFIRCLPCLITGAHPVEAAHIRYGQPSLGKREGALAMKPDDRWTVPLHSDQHRIQHTMNERQFWQLAGIDPLIIAMALWGVSGDEVAANIIIQHARKS